MFLQEQVRSQQVLLNSKFLRFEDLQHRREPGVESSPVQATKETAKATSNLALGTGLPIEKDEEMAMRDTTPMAPTAGSLRSRSPIDVADLSEEPATLMTASGPDDLSTTGRLRLACFYHKKILTLNASQVFSTFFQGEIFHIYKMAL
ncbi:uncharacterized protein LOC119378206 [Rhipicephalus sanguineus]|uniref:uncharacterized protein LOC119378206 n=1 Tax=Rhipicephalus sanguineus TaxID=34632 RepID=UPI0020C322B7|nr:uncharacterized protein LOC119378206 [Rhipicephalus sanguineus]